MSLCTAPTTHLPPGHTRVIHAHEGLALHVLHGRLWLTQPGDPADRFLTAGDKIELRQDWVVVEADAAPSPPRNGPEPVTAYRLQPLASARVSAPDTRWPWWGLRPAGVTP